MIDLEALESMLNDGIATVKLAEAKLHEERAANAREIATRMVNEVIPDICKARELKRRAGCYYTCAFRAKTTCGISSIRFSDTPITWIIVSFSTNDEYKFREINTVNELAIELSKRDQAMKLCKRIVLHWDKYRDLMFEYVKDCITEKLLERAKEINQSHKIAMTMKEELGL